MTAGSRHRAGEGLGPPGPRRRGLRRPASSGRSCRRTRDKPKYLVCNADESEPGSFKDRILMERGPHQMLEGILIARVGDRRRRRPSSTSAASTPSRREQVERAIAEALREGLPRRERDGHAASRHDVVRAARRRRLHLRRGDGPARIARGQEGPAAQEAALPRAVRRLRHADDGEQRRDLLARAAHRRRTAREWFRRLRHREEPRHHDLRCVGPRRAPGPLRAAARHAARRDRLRARGRRSAAAAS